MYLTLNDTHRQVPQPSDACVLRVSKYSLGSNSHCTLGFLGLLSPSSSVGACLFSQGYSGNKVIMESPYYDLFSFTYRYPHLNLNIILPASCMLCVRLASSKLLSCMFFFMNMYMPMYKYTGMQNDIKHELLYLKLATIVCS